MTEIFRLIDDQIPQALRELPQPPKQLYVRGTWPADNLKWITVVGSRNYTRYGGDCVNALIDGLANYPVVIVSGLALGMDTLAHEAALRNNLPTAVFPGSGLAPKSLYPAGNRGLATRILESGGALIAEFPPETTAAYWTFPSRNRLMAGIADIVIIIEAESDSGTLLTANYALEYNRSLGAVPGSIFSKTSVGTNALLRRGALPITNSNDILREVGLAEYIPLNTQSQAIKNATDAELAILKLLHEPLSRNDLARQLGQHASEIGIMISMMELKGLVTEELGEVRRIV